MVALHQPRSWDVRTVGDRKPHGGTINLPAIRSQRSFQPAPQLSVSKLIDDLLKLRLRKAKTLFEEALANVQGIVDLFNAFNARPVLGTNARYSGTSGGAWTSPTSTLVGRLVKFSAQVNF